MSVFTSPSYDGHELVSFYQDESAGLRAIIAVHNSNLGPALGGCRMYPYANEDDALEDVLRLSRGMTYKSALAGLPMGGGKAVIIGDPAKDKSDKLFEAMGDFIESQNGRYITAEDSGTSVPDIKIMARRTNHISGLAESHQHEGDPSPYTAQGVFYAIQAALSFERERSSLEGVRVGIQGVGAVGFHLAKILLENGADVEAADVNKENLDRVEKLGAIPVPVDEIAQRPLDVLSPCALGAVLNEKSIPLLQTKIIAGAANNQLATAVDGERLAKRGILYAPDFVANAGGIIEIHYQRMGLSVQSDQHIAEIASTLQRIFEQSQSSGSSTVTVAEEMAEEIFQGK